MPLYEYECGACGHRFEVIQKFSESPLERCPKCGGAVQKLQSAPAFQFKGSGWYITDYAKKDQSSSSKDESAKDTSASAKKDGSTEKGETKAAAGESKEPAAKSEKPSDKSTSPPAKGTSSSS
jgi:putative FmdB family regulatory protein